MFKKSDNEQFFQPTAANRYNFDGYRFFLNYTTNTKNTRDMTRNFLDDFIFHHFSISNAHIRNWFMILGGMKDGKLGKNLK